MNLSDAAVTVLTTADPAEKVRLSRRFAEEWRTGAIPQPVAVSVPDRPARPSEPELRPVRDMLPRRKGGSAAGRTALVHALAH